jgi:hypothetical protein
MSVLKEYLGDSVYAEASDDCDIRIYTDNGDGPTNEIWLDEGVIKSLISFIKRCEL